MYLDLFGCTSGIDDGGSGDDACAGIYVQGPAASALPLSVALLAAAAGDDAALVELFRKLEDGEIDEGDVLQVGVTVWVHEVIMKMIIMILLLRTTIIITIAITIITIIIAIITTIIIQSQQ